MSFGAAFAQFRQDFTTNIQVPLGIDHVFWGNEPENGREEGEEYLRVTRIKGDPFPELICSNISDTRSSMQTQTPGVIAIQVFEPINSGVARADAIEQAIKLEYQGETRTGLSFGAIGSVDVGMKAEMFQTNVNMQFQYFQIA